MRRNMVGDADGAYIISINPIAKGIIVVPDEKELIAVTDDGKKYSTPTPVHIAKKIQRVKYLSGKLNFFLSFAGGTMV